MLNEVARLGHEHDPVLLDQHQAGARRDPLTGEPRKMKFGPWMGSVFKVLKHLKSLRGTALDVFGYTAERRTERALVREYEKTVEQLLEGLSPQNHALAVQIASLPEEIRGFGHIKMKSVMTARKKRGELLAGFGIASVQRVAA